MHAKSVPPPLQTVASLARRENASDSTTLTLSPYWLEAAPLRERRDVYEPPSPTCDVAVVGAGFTGLAAALVLARRGRSVQVFDALPPGGGASTRNGGQVGSGNQKFRVRQLIDIHGERKAVALLHEGVAMLDHIESLIQSEHIDCAFSRCGRFRGAVRPAHYDAMARDLDDLRHYAGVESFMVPKAEQQREIGSDRFEGGAVLPNDAGLHPGLYHAGLLNRVLGAGAVVRGRDAVLGIHHDANGFVIDSALGTTQSRNVIVATNGYTGSASSPYLSRRIVPVGSAQIVTDEIPEELLKRLMPSGRMYGNTNRVFFYFRRVPGTRRVMAGGRIGRNGADRYDKFYAHLARELLAVFPALANTRITHAWHGQIGYTFDELPHLGVTPEGIHFAMGYCGTGVSRSTYFGHKIALQLLGDSSGRTAFDDLIFPSHPFRFAAEAAVPAYEAVYRLRDALNL